MPPPSVNKPALSAPLSYEPSETPSRPWPVVDWFVPETVVADNPDALRRMRLLVAAIGLVVPFFLVASLELFAAGGPFAEQGRAVVIGSALLLLCPFLLRVSRSYVLAGTTFSVILIGLQAFLALTDAGLSDSSLYWAPLVPLIAAFMVGPRAAALCTVLILVELGALYALESGGHVFPNFSDRGARAWFTVLGVAGSTCFALLLGWLYEGYTLKRLRRMNARLTRLQGALTESEARYRTLFENIPVGVYRTSPSGEVLMANNALATMLGFRSLDELRAFELKRLYEDGDGRKRFREAMINDGGVDQFESTLVTRDGRKVYVRENARAAFGEDGTVRFYEGTVEDITEHKRAKEALRASEERSRALVQNSTDTITIIDRDGVIQYQSPSVRQNLGFEPDQTVGLSFLQLVHPQDQVRVQQLLEVGLEKEGDFGAMEFWCRRADGHYIYVEAVGTNMVDKPWVNGIVLNSRDVTERKHSEMALLKAKEQAEEVAQMKSAFLANMSHEIRTPLTGILGFAGVLAEEVGDEHREFVQLIEKSGRRLLETLNSVLDLARLEADQMDLDANVLPVGEHVEDTVSLLVPLAAEKGLNLQTIVEDEAATARLDAGCLGRIVNNLVGNAIKFTMDGGVTVRVTADADKVRVQVHDTGIGIDEEFLPNLFEEFKQESTGIGRSHEGSGLGLTITRKLVEMMHGTIAVESAKETGSTFTVTFPRAEAEAYRSAPTPELPPLLETSASGAERPRVLVLDDNESARTLIDRMLAASFDVDLTSTFHEALQHAESASYDLLLLDIHLSEEVSGMDLMKRLRVTETYHATPIIAFTAFALPGDREEFLSAGFTEYLSKPFTKQQLLAVFRKALGPRASLPEPAISPGGDGAAADRLGQAQVVGEPGEETSR